MSHVRQRKGRLFVWTIGLALLATSPSVAQEKLAENASASGVADPPAAPASPAAVKPTKPASENGGDPNQPVQDKRIAGVLPNYRTADGTVEYHSITPKYKMTIALKDSFDTPNYVIGGIFAGIYMLENQHPSFGQGVEGYFHYFGTSYADQVIGNMLTEGVMPVVFHEDPRYFRKVRGSVMSRLGYAVTRTLVTKTDRGTLRANFSELVGNGIDAGIANTYYPDQRGLSQTVTRWYTQIATDSLSNVLKEFWPDIKRKLFKKDVAVQELTGTH